MPDPDKQSRIEEILRKSLLGEELIGTQFHLFSAKSSTSDRVLKPRVLSAHNDLLANSSKYFLDLLNSDVHPSDSSLIDLTGDNDVRSNIQADEYGYGSDSDLDDYNEPDSVSDMPASKDDDGSFNDGSESDSSDMFVMSLEEPREGDPLPKNKDGAGSVASSETTVQNTADDKMSGNQTMMRPQSSGSRHIFVKDTAFQTWYTLLNYLYTDKFSFLPLSSVTLAGKPHDHLESSHYEPKCSAKSMYRLAFKVGLDHLRDEALAHIRSCLTERNIIQELSCSLVSIHAELLEMELDVLYSHITSSPVVAEFPTLARRIANKELPHGADVVVGIHARLLKASQPTLLEPVSPVVSPPSISGIVEPVKVTASVNCVFPVKDKEEPTQASKNTPVARATPHAKSASKYNHWM